MMHANAKVLRGWALFDLAVTALLVLPPVARVLLETLIAVNGALGGVAPAVPALGLLFAGIAGTLGVLWAIVRLRRPTTALGTLDAVARAWVGVLIAYCVFALGVPAVFLLFVLTEWAGAIHQGMVLVRRRNAV